MVRIAPKAPQSETANPKDNAPTCSADPLPAQTTDFPDSNPGRGDVFRRRHARGHLAAREQRTTLSKGIKPKAATPPQGPTQVFPVNAGIAGIWVWDSNALSQPRESIAAARSAGANTLFVNPYPLSPESQARVVEFARLARGEGIELQCLLGNPDWSEIARRPWLRDNVVGPLQRLATANQDLGIAAPMVVHLDVEPHLTGSMTEQRARDFVAMLVWLKKELAPLVQIEADVPIWYAEIALDGQSLAGRILDEADGVTLMAHERNAERIIRETTPWLCAAASRGKKVNVAIEAGVNNEQLKTESRRELADVLSELQNAFVTSEFRSAWGGLAVHSLKQVQNLKP